MTPRYGIDTSVLVRLVTGHPEPSFEYSLTALRALIENGETEIFASNQNIGEAFAAIQHHYRISKVETRSGLLDVLQSGLVAPLNGVSVLAALEASGGAARLDRLIATDYARAGLSALTNCRRAAASQFPCHCHAGRPSRHPGRAAGRLHLAVGQCCRAEAHTIWGSRQDDLHARLPGGKTLAEQNVVSLNQAARCWRRHSCARS